MVRPIRTYKNSEGHTVTGPWPPSEPAQPMTVARFAKRFCATLAAMAAFVAFLFWPGMVWPNNPIPLLAWICALAVFLFAGLIAADGR